MEGWVRSAVEAIHSSPTQAVLYVSGGASQALGHLMSVPGASNTVLESVVPYCRMSMIQLLGKIPAHFASQQTAEEMALLAYNRALRLSKPGSPALGVGFTGSLASTCPKRGDHRFHMSTRTSNRLWASTVTLSKGLRTREQEDKVSSLLLLQAIAHACKVPATFVSALTESEVYEEHEKHFNEDQELEQLINGQICFKLYPFSSEAHKSNADRKIILSGSFNPLHEGHLKLLDVATSICGHDAYPCFELSAINADKPPLTVSQIKERVKQFEKVGRTIIISTQPYFYKKTDLFPGSTFVIGADTAVRLINNLLQRFVYISIASCFHINVEDWQDMADLIVEPKYYDGSYQKMLEILGGCKRTGCTFLVGGRNIDGVFKVLGDFEIPEELEDMFIPIPADTFRMDISSTEIRNRQRI